MSDLEATLAEMRAILNQRDDNEDRHRQADALVCRVLRELGYGALADLYEPECEANFWYG